MALPMEFNDCVIKGYWQVWEEGLYWVWVYASGWKRNISCLNMMMASTKQCQRQWFMVEVVTKVNQVYDTHGMERPDPEQLCAEMDRQVITWVSRLCEDSS